MHMYLENLVINQKRIKKIRYRRTSINDITFRTDLFDLKCQLDVLTIRNKMFVCYGLQLVIKQWISVDFSCNNVSRQIAILLKIDKNLRNTFLQTRPSFLLYPDSEPIQNV